MGRKKSASDIALLVAAIAVTVVNGTMLVFAFYVPSRPVFLIVFLSIYIATMAAIIWCIVALVRNKPSKPKTKIAAKQADDTQADSAELDGHN